MSALPPGEMFSLMKSLFKDDNPLSLSPQEARGLGFGVGETLRSPPVEDVGVVKGRHYVKQRLMAAERIAFQRTVVRQPVCE